MIDIAPELLAKLQEAFKAKFRSSSKVKKLNELISAGKANYRDANEFAIEIGEILAKVYEENLSGSNLPDGKMYYNIARRIVEPTLKQNYELASSYSAEVQTDLNARAKLSLKGIKPELNQDRIDGIINRLVEADQYDDVKWLLDEPVVNFTQSVVDDTIKANIDFHYKCGLSPKIIRTSTGHCCDWCNQMVGEYRYPNEMPKDIFRRHRYCRCTVDYSPEDGSKRRQDIWSKKWKNEAYQSPLSRIKNKLSISKTSSEAQGYASNELGLSLSDYSKIHVDIANSINTEVNKAYSLFPEFKKAGKLNGVRVYSKKAEFYAAYAPRSGIIWVKNVGGKSSFGKMRRDAIKNYRAGFWSSNKKEHVIRHELGHAVEHTYCDNNPHKKTKISDLFQSIRKECGVSNWKLAATDKEILAAGQKLSYYGLKDEGEFVAESIAEYMSGKSRETAKMVIEILLGD